jgi:hypothetical protein
VEDELLRAVRETYMSEAHKVLREVEELCAGQESMEDNYRIMQRSVQEAMGSMERATTTVDLLECGNELARRFLLFKRIRAQVLYLESHSA